MQENKLRLAARHVGAGLRIVARQRAIIVRLEENGCSTLEAVRTLELFERTLALFEEHHREILDEIANPGKIEHWRSPHCGIRRLYQP
jgi:hypothetical protein